MQTLQAKIDSQTAAVQAHRERLGLGEYWPLMGPTVLDGVDVTTRDDSGQVLTLKNSTVHIGRSTVVIYHGDIQNGRRLSIVRRLGAPGFTIEGL